MSRGRAFGKFRHVTQTLALMVFIWCDYSWILFIWCRLLVYGWWIHMDGVGVVQLGGTNSCTKKQSRKTHQNEMSHVRKLSVTWTDRRACRSRSLCAERQQADVETLRSLRSLTRTNPPTDVDHAHTCRRILAVTEIAVELKSHMHYLSSPCVK